MLAVYDVCRVGKTDDKYLKIMSSVPNAEKYDLFTVDNVLFVPLDQVYDLMTKQPDPDTVSRPQEQRYGYWMRMSDLNESEDDRYKCSCCGNVVHHRDKVFLYTYNSWCGACGADMISKDAHGAWRRHATKGGAV